MTNKMPTPKGHTPGPWFAGKPYKDCWGQEIITIGSFESEDHIEDTICEVWGGNHNAKINARLIVAAVNHYLGLEND